MAAAYVRARDDAAATAREKFPHLIDEETLLDPRGDNFWPPELFARLFKVPDAIVSFEGGDQEGEVRLWSKALVDANSQHEEYLEHKEYVERERREHEEEERQLAEERRLQEEEERQLAEERRQEVERLEQRKSQQIVVSMAELKKSQ